MELRKRKRRRRPNSIRKSVRQDPYPAYAFAVLVFLAIVYAIGASRAGGYAAEHWIAPAMARLSARGAEKTPAATPTVVPVVIDTPAEKTLEADLVEKSWYAIQLGVYASMDNAAKQSAELQKIGAAGYTITDGEHYRVLASCYETEADAQSVKTRLATEGVDSRIHSFMSAGRRITITAEAEKAETVCKAFEAAQPLLAQVYAFVIRFDQESMTVETAEPALQEIVRAAELHRAALSDLASEDAVAFAAFYEDAVEALDALAAETDRVACAAKLKYAYLSLVDAYCRLQTG